MTNEKAAAEHHVHFDQTTLKDEDFESDGSCVTYQQVGDNIVDVHLGFLQHKHRYLIELHLPADLFKCQTTNVPINLVADNNIAPNEHCKLADRVTELVKDLNENDNQAATQKATTTTTTTTTTSSPTTSTTNKQKFFVIKVEYFAHKEKLLREELKLVNANNSVELLKLLVTSRVLGQGKGTPMLRNGVHCLGDESDSESIKSNKSEQKPTFATATTSK